MPQNLRAEENLIKHTLYDSFTRHAVKQQVIASVLQINQSTVSRMTNPAADTANLSVADLSLLHQNKFTAPIADDILESIGGRFHDTPVAEPDGSLFNELVDLSRINGRLATIIQDGVQKNELNDLIAMAATLEDLAKQIRSEVAKAKEGK